MTDNIVASTSALSRVGLGRGGPVVSRLGLGTMTFGVETDETTAHRQLDTFVEAGGTLIDTADVYADGESERIIGRWAAGRGGMGDLIVATKGRFAPPPGSHGASRQSLVHSVDASLRRLGVDAIDLYYVHGWDTRTPVEETLDALSSLISAGKIHDIGWSNVTGWQLQRIVSTAELGGYRSPVAVQPQYNLLDRGIELEVLPASLESGIDIVPWSPLGGGWLAGKYQRDRRPSGHTRLGENPARGVEAYNLRNTGRTWRIIDTLSSIAERYERPCAHVALAWLSSRPGVASILIGARTVGQLLENLGAADLDLEKDSLDELTAVSASGLPPYPYGMVQDFCEVDVWRRLGLAG